MEKVIGVGGLFFRSKQTERTAQWYTDVLGVPTKSLFWQQAGPTVWAPFAEDTDYFGRSAQQWMITFRVNDLDRFVAQLRKAGIEVSDPKAHETGRFSRLNDPEGNPIELWEPVDEDELKRIEQSYAENTKG